MLQRILKIAGKEYVLSWTHRGERDGLLRGTVTDVYGISSPLVGQTVEKLEQSARQMIRADPKQRSVDTTYKRKVMVVSPASVRCMAEKMGVTGSFLAQCRWFCRYMGARLIFSRKLA